MLRLTCCPFKARVGNVEETSKSKPKAAPRGLPNYSWSTSPREIKKHHHNECKQQTWLLLVLTASLFSPSAPSVLLANVEKSIQMLTLV